MWQLAIGPGLDKTAIGPALGDKLVRGNMELAIRGLQFGCFCLDKTAKALITRPLDTALIKRPLDMALIRPAFAENGLAPASYGSLRNPITGVPRARKLKLFSTMARRNLIAGRKADPLF